MPIKGLTDRQAPTFPKIGDIRKGAPKTQNDRPGKDLKHFRAVFSEGETEAAAKFTEVYGGEPREINIFLPFDDIARNFEAWRELHTASALQCRGEGFDDETQTGSVVVLSRRQDGTVDRAPSKRCPAEPCKGCKETGRLKIIVPELRRLAYITVHTTSKWDIIELTENLNALRELTSNGLKGIPCILKRRRRTVSTPRGNGKRVRQEKWLLSIEAHPRWVDAQIQRMEAESLALAQLTETVNAEQPIVNTVTGEVLAEWDETAFEAGKDDDNSNAPDFPIGYNAFVQMAVAELEHYKSAASVTKKLKAHRLFCDSAGDCNFDGMDAWTVLQEQAT